MAVPKHVQFGDVQVRKHAMILGDNPATRKGLPVTIEWKHFDSETTSIELYEYLAKQAKAQSRRDGHSLRKPNRLRKEYRRTYLASLGIYTNADFLEVLMESTQIQESRMLNAGEENLDKFNDFFETSAKALKGASSIAVDAVFRSSKVIGDSSSMVVKEAVTVARKGSIVAVGVALSAGKVTTDAAVTVGSAARRGSQMAVGAATTASTAALRGSAVAVGAAVNASKATTHAAYTAGKASVDMARNASKATSQVAVNAGKATTSAATGAKSLVQAAVRAPIELTHKVMAGRTQHVRGTGGFSTGPAAKTTVATSQSVSDCLLNKDDNKLDSTASTLSLSAASSKATSGGCLAVSLDWNDEFPENYSSELIPPSIKNSASTRIVVGRQHSASSSPLRPTRAVSA